MRKLAAFCCIILSGCTALTPRVAPPMVAGSHYVAMGSSFAAGPGIMPSADTLPTRCTRSANNYAHQLSARLKLDLTDVSCRGAKTAHLFGAWNELPAQLDALRANTRLVTVTIGGNDIGYIGGLFAASCAGNTDSDICKAMAARREQGQVNPPEPDDAAWKNLEDQLNSIASEVRRRSPTARLVFVDYLTVLPANGSCILAPVDSVLASISRNKAKRLADITARSAAKSGAGLIRASRLSVGHDICAVTPWMTGFVASVAPCHPNIAGMTAVADELEREVRKK